MNELDVLKRFRENVPEPSTDAWLRARAAIEAARAERYQPPAHPTVPHRRYPRRQRRVAVVGLGIAVAVATVGVTLALATQGPSAPVGHPDSGGRAIARPDAAAIRAHLVDVLSGKQDTIFHTQSSTKIPGQPTSTAEEWDYPWNGQPGQTVRQAGSGSVGGTLQNKWSLAFTVPVGGPPTNINAPGPGAACNVSGQRIDVDITNQTWQPSEQSCVALSPGLDTVAFVDTRTGQLISNITTLVADRLLQVVGYPTVDGQPTIELRSDMHGALAFNLWVNAGTYLPVQSVTTEPTGDPNPGKTSTTVDQYSFLSPTPANLAYLHVAVPTGFRKITSPGKG